ncbi:hypothetical protein H8E07_17650 [bacterium]|nr:hypothetical protein [bacterium]
MAPTTSTTLETPRTGPDLLDGLIEIYGRERVLYLEVLQLSREQAAQVERGEGLAGIRRLLDAKRECLDEISRLEHNSLAARGEWERLRHGLTGAQPVRLQQSLQAVGELIEKILQVEAENDRLFMSLAG